MHLFAIRAFFAVMERGDGPSPAGLKGRRAMVAPAAAIAAGVAKRAGPWGMHA